MKMAEEIPVAMVAPCGINCAACRAHLRKNKPCPGCRGQDTFKSQHCVTCKMKICALGQGLDFCVDCASFPCATVKHIDKRYREKYQISLIGCALRLKTVGAQQYMIEEKEKWTCVECGGIISLHDHFCSDCGKEE